MRAIIFITLVLLPSLALANHHSIYVYAKVEQVEAIYDLVRMPQRHVHPDKCYTTVSSTRSPNPTILGAVIGSVIGSTFGHDKSSNRITTVTGAILGGAIAHDVTQHKQDRKVKTVCHHKVVQKRQLRGYNVTYHYQGQRYNTFMSQHPGNRIKLKIQMTPAFMSSS